MVRHVVAERRPKIRRHSVGLVIRKPKYPGGHVLIFSHRPDTGHDPRLAMGKEQHVPDFVGHRVGQHDRMRKTVPERGFVDVIVEEPDVMSRRGKR